VIARLTNPARFIMAKIMVRVDECSQAYSFSRRSAVPIAIRINAVVLMKFLILGFIIAYSPIPVLSLPTSLPLWKKRGCTPLKHPNTPLSYMEVRGFKGA